MVRSAAVSLNGITIAYAMGIVNAALALAVSFGVHLSSVQQGYLAAILNGAMVLMAHVSHRVGEASATGSSTAASIRANAATSDMPLPASSLLEGMPTSAEQPGASSGSGAVSK